MKYSGQKFFILLGLFLIPILFIGALLREPVVNRGLLRITLSILKNKVGASLKAQTWKVDLSKFAVAVEGVEFKHDNLVVSAQELRAEFSPLYLLIGKIYFSRVWANEVLVWGTLPKPKPKSDNEEINLEKLVKLATEEMVNAQKIMEAKGLGFEIAEISSLKIKTNLLELSYGDLLVENFGVGHVKTEVALEQILSVDNFPLIERMHLSAVLFKDLKSSYLSLRKLNLELTHNNSLHTTLEARGRLPGETSFDLISDLNQLQKWLRKQPQKSLKNLASKNMAGYLELRGSALFEGAGVKQGEIGLLGRSLGFDGFFISDIEGRTTFKDKAWKISKLKGTFPSTRLDKKAKNTFSAEDVLLSPEKVSGNLKLDRMGLCAMLRGLTVPECYLDLVFSGNVELGGTLKPFKLIPQLDIKSEPFEVFSDPDFSHLAASGRLLRARPAHVTGVAEVKESELNLSDIRAKFSDETTLEARGTIKYVPTRVYLSIAADKAKLQDLVYDFLTLEVKGLTRAEVTVDYDRKRDPALGRTDFFADYLIKGLGVSFLPLGDASGKLHFMKKILEFKPTLRNGPGTLKVTGQIGKIHPTDSSSQMSIYAEADDYEILVPSENNKPIFDGVFDFETHLKGSLADSEAQPFGGVLNATIHSMSSFGIPFERGLLRSYVDLKGIKIDSLLGFKGQVQTDLKGYLAAKDSRVEFESQYVPIKMVGYMPEFEKLAQSGDLKASGFWDQNKGWAVDINTQNLKVGPSVFPSLSMKVGGGRGDSFFMNVDSSDDIQIRYDSMAETVKAKLRDSGIFLGLTLINKWERVPEFLKVKGDMDVFWSRNQGSVLLDELDIQATDRFSESDKQLIKLESPAKINYLDSKIIGQANFKSGQGFLMLKGEGPNMLASGKLPLRLFDLFLPDVVRLIDGSADLTAKWEPKSSDLRADAKLNNATAYLPALGAELRSIGGSLSFTNGNIYFNDLEGRSGETGDFTLGGSMSADAQKFNLISRMRSVGMRIGRDVDLVISGDMSLVGDEQPFLLKGRARVEKGLLRREFSGAAYKTAVLEKPYLKFDLPFELFSGFQVKNSLTDAFVVGKGKLLGSEINPVISGRFDVVKGTLLAKDNEFAINFARVDLPQDPVFDPINVNVQASTIKNYQSIDYRIFLAAEGDPDNLKLNFRSEPSLSQKELIALVTLGYVPQEQPVGGQGGAIAQSASAEAFQLLFGQALGKGIQKQTGFDVRVGTSANLKQEDTIPKVSVYRRLGDRVSATFGRSLDVSRPENNFKVDYRLLKNLNLTGVWENPEENRHSLGLDLRLEFEIK